MKYPWNSSYAFSENRVIEYVELEGAEIWKKKWWIDYGTGILKVFKGTKDMVVDMATTYHQSPIYDKVLGTWVFKTKTANAIANDPVGAAKNAGNLALGAQLPVIIYDQLSEDGGERQGEVTGNALLFFAFKGGGKLLDSGEVAGTASVIEAESDFVSLTKDIVNKTRRLSERVKTLPKALQIRPKWRKSTIEYLEKNAPKENGYYIDAKTKLPITGNKHIGHLYESWREYQDNPANWGKTRKQVIDDYNNVDNLGYQDGPTNCSDGAGTRGLENTNR